MDLQSREDVEQFLERRRTVTLDQLAAGTRESDVEEESEVFSTLCSDRDKYAELTSPCGVMMDDELQVRAASLSSYDGSGADLNAGQRILEFHMPTSSTVHKKFIIPLWRKEQEKSCFVPDILKTARQCHCRLIVLLDGDRSWAEEASNPCRKCLTLSDSTVDSSIDSECSDKDGNCVLTWLRVYRPGERIQLDTPDTEENDGYHNEKVFNAMTQEDCAYGGYRCAILRVDNAAWGSKTVPSNKVCNALEALIHRGYSEAVAAYSCRNVLLVDVCDDYFHESAHYWGYGDRAAALIALDTFVTGISIHAKEVTESSSTKAITTGNCEKSEVMEKVANHTDCSSLLPGCIPNTTIPPPPPSELDEAHIEAGVQGIIEFNKNIESNSSAEVSVSGKKNVEFDFGNNSNNIVEGQISTTEALVACAQKSNEMNLEYLSKQKQLSKLKLEARLKKRKEEKEKRKLSSTCNKNDDGSDLSEGTKPAEVHHSSAVNFAEEPTISLADIFWYLLEFCRCISVTPAQRQWVYKMATLRAQRAIKPSTGVDPQSLNVTGVNTPNG